MILLYHLIFPDSTPKDAWNAGLILRLSAFKRQMMWLKQHGEILPLDEYLIGYREDPGNLKGKYALTFDDGYQEVFDLVAPFLIAENIPATFLQTRATWRMGGCCGLFISMLFAVRNAMSELKLRVNNIRSQQTKPVWRPGKN